MYPASPAPLRNHLAFMESHRGSIRVSDDAVELVGDAEFLSWWTPLRGDTEVPASAHTVRLFPWSDEAWPARLSALGFEPAGELRYMEAPVIPTRPHLPDGVAITVVASNSDAEDFAKTQATGFLSTDLPSGQWWHDTFREVALRNYADPAQTFYVLRYREECAAVSLALHTDGACGIYAVTTVPAHRGRGFANLLLGRVGSDAARRGDSELILQVEVGSDAERLYQKAGFTSSFVSTLYQR